MKFPKVSIICAVSENRVIGRGDKIPWHIREDLLYFKEKTEGRVVILGRKTFESLLSYYQKSGNLLPKRIHIVVSRDPAYQIRLKDCYLADSVTQALFLAKKLEKKEIFIAGGAEIFNQTIDLADKIYLTLVKGNFEGNKFFPDYSAFTRVVKKTIGKSKDHEYVFLELEKK